MELIDRRATIEKFCSDYCGCTPEECDLTYETDGTEECDKVRQLKEMPTIEAEPVKHGKWIAVDSYSAFGGDEVTWYAHGNPIAFYYCSECKEQTYADEEGNSILSKYCPNCGAKMEEGEA